MAGRGRGRGRGRGGGFTTFATQVPFVLYPEDVNLPDVKINEIDANMKKLLNWSYKFENYWKASPYLLEETTLKDRKRIHIERFSDKKKTMFTRDSLSQVLMFKDFPKELVQGTSKRMPSRKKNRWNPESDHDVCVSVTEMKKLDFFLQQEEKRIQGREDKDEKEKKDGENEDDDENVEDEEGEEDFSDDDYNQNEYFDDDEDDYNDVDDGNDEGIL